MLPFQNELIELVVVKYKVIQTFKSMFQILNTKTDPDKAPSLEAVEILPDVDNTLEESNDEKMDKKDMEKIKEMTDNMEKEKLEIVDEKKEDMKKDESEDSAVSLLYHKFIT